jgi:hypothetical protein
VVEAGVELAVVVTDARSEPVPGVLLAAADAGGRLVRAMESTPGSRPGEHLLRSLPAGDLRIYAGDAEHGTGWVDVPAGVSSASLRLLSEGARLRVVATRSGATVEHTVRLRDASGRPVLDLSQRFPRDRLVSQAGMASESGILPPGTYRLELTDDRDERHAREVELAPGAGTVEVRFEL